MSLYVLWIYFYIVYLCSPVDAFTDKLQSTLIDPLLALSGIGSVLKFVLPDRTKDQWSEYNKELHTLIQPVHSAMANNTIDPRSGGNDIILTTQKFLMNKPEFYQPIKDNKQFINKGSRTLQKAKSVKNSLHSQANGQVIRR